MGYLVTSHVSTFGSINRDTYRETKCIGIESSYWTALTKLYEDLMPADIAVEVMLNDLWKIRLSCQTIDTERSGEVIVNFNIRRVTFY